LLRRELEPFIIGVGEIRVILDEAMDELVVVRLAGDGIGFIYAVPALTANRLRFSPSPPFKPL